MGVQNLSGQSFGQYELRELLGAGGMGAVYKGYQRSLKRYVAVKVLGAQFSQQTGAIERFNREAETSAALEHPNIIHIYDYGTQQGINYLVMQLLTGGTLAERIDQRVATDQPLPSMGEVADLLKQLASALDYAHSKGVIHRDIKPSNVMFDNHGTAYLVDFGIARLAEATSGLTASGMVIGTWAYMAPEQWRAETPTPATDQYALAVMSYALITGQMPFDAPTPAGIMHKHLNEQPTPPHTRRPDVPEAVTLVLERAMAKKAEDRFPACTAFAQAFDKAIRGSTGEVTGFFTASVRSRRPASPAGAYMTGAAVTPPPAARPFYRQPALWVMGAVILVLALIVAFLLLGQDGGQEAASPTLPATTAVAFQPSDTPPAIASATEAPTASPSPAATPTTAPLVQIAPTELPSPAPTQTPSLPPTLSETDTVATLQAEMALVQTESVQTAEAAATETAMTPTATLTLTVEPSQTPDLRATAAFLVTQTQVAIQTASAAAWTDTPTETPAPTATETMRQTNTPTISPSPTFPPPLLDPIPAQTVIAGQSIVVESISRVAPGQSTTRSEQSADESIVTIEAVEIAGLAEGGTRYVYRLTGHQPGMAQVTIAVSDGAGQRTEVMFVVTVLAPTPTPSPTESPEETWVMSAHADAEAEPFRHWDGEIEIPQACARCHSEPGYLDYLGEDGTAANVVDNPAPLGTVITCNACHNASAEQRDMAIFPSGAEMAGLGNSANCMECHQGRASTLAVNTRIESLVLDTPSQDLTFLNIHYDAAAASLLGSEVHGGYEYEGRAYQPRLAHVPEFDTCTECHDPHSLEVAVDQCAACHPVAATDGVRAIPLAEADADFDGDGISESAYEELEGLQALLDDAIQKYGLEVAAVPIAYDATYYPYFFQDLNNSGQIDPEERTTDNRYMTFTPRLLLAAYNYQVYEKDAGAFAHNARYHAQLLYDSIASLNTQLGSPVDLSSVQRAGISTAGATPASGQATHIVQVGETLGGIALMYGLELQVLLDANPQLNPDVLQEGDVLVIPISD